MSRPCCFQVGGTQEPVLGRLPRCPQEAAGTQLAACTITRALFDGALRAPPAEAPQEAGRPVWGAPSWPGWELQAAESMFANLGVPGMAQGGKQSKWVTACFGAT